MFVYNGWDTAFFSVKLRLRYMHAIHTLTAIFGQQRRVNVDDSVREGFYKRGIYKEASQYNKINFFRPLKLNKFSSN